MEKSESASLQSRVKQYLSDTGRKKKWLADQLGISPTLLSQWFAGKTVFPNHRLSAIVEIISQK